MLELELELELRLELELELGLELELELDPEIPGSRARLGCSREGPKIEKDWQIEQRRAAAAATGLFFFPCPIIFDFGAFPGAP